MLLCVLIKKSCLLSIVNLATAFHFFDFGRASRIEEVCPASRARSPKKNLSKIFDFPIFFISFVYFLKNQVDKIQHASCISKEGAIMHLDDL